MSIEKEFEGKTVTDAAIDACKELGISRDELEFTVVQEESSGVLGIGSRKAIIRILNKGEKQENKIDSSINPLDDNLENFTMTDRFTLMVKSVAMFNEFKLIRPSNIPMLEEAFELNISEILQWK